MQAATFPKKIKVTDVTFTTSTAGGGSGSSFQNSLLNGLGLFSGASYVSNTTPPRLELAVYGSGTITNVDFPQYQTLSDISTAGYKTLTEIQALGYQTIASLTTAGYKTAADTLTDVAAVGYQTVATLTTNGYKTVANTLTDVAALHYLKSEIDTQINGIKNRTGSTNLNNSISSLENNTGSTVLKTAVDTNTSLRAKAKGTLSFSGTSSGSITLSNSTNSSASLITKSTGNSYNHMGQYSFYNIYITFSSTISNNYQVLLTDGFGSVNAPLMAARISSKSASGFNILAFFHGGGTLNYQTWELDFVVI